MSIRDLIHQEDGFFSLPNLEVNNLIANTINGSSASSMTGVIGCLAYIADSGQEFTSGQNEIVYLNSSDPVNSFGTTTISAVLDANNNVVGFKNIYLY